MFGVLLVLVLQYARDGLWPRLCGAAARRRQAAADCGRAAAAPPQARRTARRCWTSTGVRKEFGGLVAVNDVSFDVSAARSSA